MILHFMEMFIILLTEICCELRLTDLKIVIWLYLLELSNIISMH